MCVKKGPEDQPVGTSSTILTVQVQNEFNNRETEKNILM
jgi:hypothetical protein